MALSEKDVAIIVERCRSLPPARRPYVQTDFILNLFLAVLDYRSSAEAVRKALTNYRRRWWDKIRDAGRPQEVLEAVSRHSRRQPHGGLRPLGVSCCPQDR
jgi:hypothetical protein